MAKPVGKMAPEMKSIDRIIPASKELLDMMEQLRQMPPPTSEQVETQLRASEEIPEKDKDRQRYFRSGPNKPGA